MINVALYQTLGAEACVFMINQVGLETIVVDTEDKIRDLLSLCSETPTLKRLVFLGTVSESLKKDGDDSGVMIVSFQDVQNYGKENIKDPVPPKPDDMFTICYTSGTTGNPKGVVLTHEYMLLLMSGFFRMIAGNKDCELGPNDCIISYLPLAHIYDRFNSVNMWIHGGRIGFYRGDVKLLMDDIEELGPTFLPCVPRVLNKVYDAVLNGVRDSFIKSKLLQVALYFKEKQLASGQITNDSIWDKLVFSKLQKRLGGHLKIVSSAAAPISPDVLRFCRCAFGCSVLEGYGQSEFILATMSVPGDMTVGHVGPPTPCAMVKLCDVPDMGYSSDEGKGEICLKTLVKPRGYYKDPEKTAELIDDDGWVHTGDIGMWQENGTLKIIDRKKHLFKLAQGEYIAPEKIENVISTGCRLVSQVFVDGISDKTFCVAVTVPEEPILLNLAKEMGIEGNLEELCSNKDIKKAVLDDIAKISKEGGLSSLEVVKNVYLESKPFSIEEQLLTATMKNKRPALRKRYQEIIENLYK